MDRKVKETTNYILFLTQTTVKSQNMDFVDGVCALGEVRKEGK